MKTQDVRIYTAQRLHWLWALPDNQRRAELAKLRRGVGRKPGDLPELWGSFLRGMPEDFQGRCGPSRAEWAVYLAPVSYTHLKFAEGDWISIDGSTGNIYGEQVATVAATGNKNFNRFMGWADAAQMCIRDRRSAARLQGSPAPKGGGTRTRGPRPPPGAA